MSTKFSGLSKVQKPPAVCRAPPPPDGIPLPPFAEQIFQGYAHWFDNSGSNRFSVSGYMDLIPDAPFLLWFGQTQSRPHALRLEMRWTAPADTFNYTITLLKDGFPIDSYIKTNQSARSLDPFDSGLVDFIGQGSLKIVQARIMA